MLPFGSSPSADPRPAPASLATKPRSPMPCLELSPRSSQNPTGPEPSLPCHLYRVLGVIFLLTPFMPAPATPASKACCWGQGVEGVRTAPLLLFSQTCLCCGHRVGEGHTWTTGHDEKYRFDLPRGRPGEVYGRGQGLHSSQAVPPFPPGDSGPPSLGQSASSPGERPVTLSPHLIV